ncbi:MAG: polysaccharide biosynthesis protein [Cellvibrionaceae bacterium]
MIGRLFEAPRNTKRLISLAYDSVALSFSLYFSICLRLGRFDVSLNAPEIISLGITLIVSLFAFVQLGLYRAILRFMAHQALIHVALGVFISAATLATVSFFLNSAIPRSVPIIYAFAALFFVGTPRLFIRSVILLLDKEARHTAKETVVIYGAGNAGFQLANELQGSKFKVVGFVDDNPKLHKTLLRGLTVHKPEKLPRLLKQLNVKHILLALGNTPRSKRAIIVNKLEPLGISIKTMPAMSDVLSGKSKIEDIKDVDVEDLLGRDPVQPIPELLDACIKDKHVLVTGAGGSIGSELCKQILKHSPKKLVLLELNEYNLYKVEQELKSQLASQTRTTELVFLMGSAQNEHLLTNLFNRELINTVYHAAAYKHVPIIEDNIIEGIKNNILGTWYCAEAAIAANVDSFVLISTDKAVRPTNIMGATKRVAELVLQALSKRQSDTRFTMVRFGNVLGSSGSVVPLFRKQIKSGGPVTVTHKDITRYFMTIPEAAELVIQAGSMGTGGDVFVLDMGDPVKITDLAVRMIHLSGLTLKDDNNANGDIEIHFTGLRPGEKLYEELLIGEEVSGTNHPRIMRAEEMSLEWKETQKLLEDLSSSCLTYECETAKKHLLSAPTGYQNNDLGAEKIITVKQNNIIQINTSK